jgi:hypothetical protein
MMNAKEQAANKVGPCCLFEAWGKCPKGEQCCCSHKTREELEDLHKVLNLGPFLQNTKGARMQWTFEQIKKGNFYSPGGIFNENAPCLVEMVDTYTRQKMMGAEKLRIVKDFIKSNKTTEQPICSQEPMSGLPVLEEGTPAEGVSEKLTSDEEAFMRSAFNEMLESGLSVDESLSGLEENPFGDISFNQEEVDAEASLIQNLLIEHGLYRDILMPLDNLTVKHMAEIMEATKNMPRIGTLEDLQKDSENIWA